MRDDTIYIADIIESIHLIFRYVKDYSEFDFSQDLLIQDAVYRRFEIIGEAAGNVSEEFRAKHPNVEWRLMKAMRNKLSHQYFGISSSTVYNTIHTNLPPLLEKLLIIQSTL